MIGFQSIYSDTYKCLTSMVVHCRHVEWIMSARLSLFPDITLPTTVEALERSLMATGLDLLAQREKPSSPAGATEALSHGSAVLHVDLEK